MKRKIIFCVCYILILMIPAITLNTEKNAVSEIDNTYLPEFKLDINHLEQIGTYVEKRIGGRNEAILAYEVVNDRVFHILEHPLYMYGQDEWVYFKGTDYLNDYLRLNVDENYAEDFAEYVATLSDIAQANDAYFLYVMCVDKKTIYPEYFVEGLNPDNKLSRAELIWNTISKTGVNCLCAKDKLLEAKENGLQVYNQKFDAGHWNEDGAFLVCQEIYKNLRQYDENIPMLVAEDYNIGTKVEEYLLTSEFRIDEEVPFYENKTLNAIVDTTYDDMVPGKIVYFRHYTNETVDAPKILIFRDSYIDMVSKFFVENFSETTFASYSNLTSIEDFKEYLKIFKPDIVMFENVERTFPLSIPE